MVKFLPNLRERIFKVGPNLVNFVKKNPLESLLFAFIFLLFTVQAGYVSYPDEFVNVLGGEFITKGLLPYKSFFDHHLPLAWYLASFFLIFSGKSFVTFRLLWSIFNFLVLFLLASYLRKNNYSLYRFYLVFFFLYPLMAVYFWFHLYLADSLAVLFFSTTFWVLLSQTAAKEVNPKIIISSSLLVFFLVFSSLTYIYLALILYLWQWYLLGFKLGKQTFKFFAWIVVPYLIYFAYLLVTGSFKEFYFSNFVYNSQLYISIPNYVRGRFFNPIKFGMTLVYNFFQGYLPLITKVKYFDLYLPIGVLAGFSTLVLFFLFLEKSWILSLIFFFILSFSAPRSNIAVANETDYQGSLFLMLGLSCALFVLYYLKKLDIPESVSRDLKRVARTVIAIFLLFSAVFLFANSYGKYYLRYTQKLPSIYDSSNTYDLVNTLIADSDYYWIGPYEPQEMFYPKKGKLPGKYISLLPQFKENDYTRSSFIQQFEQNPPVFIIYKQDASIFMTPALKFGDFFLDWMKDRYTVLEKINGVKLLKNPSDFNILTDLYLRNDKKNEELEKLANAGYVELIAVTPSLNKKPGRF